MCRLLKFALIAALMTQSSLLVQGDVPDDLTKWVAIDPPKVYSEAWYVWNWDIHEWAVRLRNGRLRVELIDHKAEKEAPLPFEVGEGTADEGLYGRRFTAKVDDGWIVAFNSGEFGGGLWWFSPDGKNRYKIAKAWIQGFISTDDGLLALEGLAHLAVNKGRLTRLIRPQNGRWSLEDVIDLKHQPEVAIKMADGSLIIATTHRLLRVLPAGRKMAVLVDDAFWQSLYPNSIVAAPEGTFYLGLRHGVAKVEKFGASYKVVALLPNQEFVNMKQQLK